MSKAIEANFIDARRVTITKEKLGELYQIIRELYLNDNRPWVIGYSGGKDSTATVQAVWYALKDLPRDKLTKPVYVIASDTLVETPVIVDHLTRTLDQINVAAQSAGLPFSSHKVVPELDDTFWVNLIGRGYPAPYNKFRWCTDRMKIRPATKFIVDKVTTFGEVTLILGARKAESASRAQVMNSRRKVDERLSRHCDIPGAWVFTPLEDWQTEDVWMYLLTTAAPWGGHNRDLVTMYKNAQAGECPLVVDKTTPSCGSSRFGCWTCTVVTKDKSMEPMVEGGQEWMEPLLAFRNWLSTTQDPATKRDIREHRRRSGRVEFLGEGDKKKLKWGPYKLAFRQEILRRLLQTQESIRKEGPNPEAVLITEGELLRIRQLWRFEEGDWEDTLPRLHKEITSRELSYDLDDWSGMGQVEHQLLTEVANTQMIPEGLIRELFDAERDQYGMSRRSRIYDRIDAILKKDWSSRESVLHSVGLVDDEVEGE